MSYAIVQAQAQSEAEAERSAEEAGNSGAAGATAETGGGDHAGDDEQGAGEEEALLQHSSPTDTSAPQGLERWRGKVALVTGPFLSSALTAGVHMGFIGAAGAPSAFATCAATRN